MDKSMIKGVVIGGIAMVAVTASGITGYKAMTKPQFADVVEVKDATQSITTPREKCQDVAVQTQAPVKDQHRIAGTVIGGVAGGLIGNQIGGGTGRTIATVAGAGGGAYAGNQVQKSLQQRDVTTTTERRCQTVNETSQKHVGYDVTYRLDGKQDVVRMAYKPGSQIPVKDGQLVLSPPAPAK